MADVGTQRPPSPPHQNHTNQNGYHGVSDEQMDWMLKQNTEAMSAEEKKELLLNSKNKDDEQLTQSEVTDHKNSTTSSQSDTDKQTPLTGNHTSHQEEDSGSQKTPVTPTKPNRPKSSGTSRSLARAHVQSKQPDHSDDEIPSLSSSSSSLSDMITNPQSVDPTAPPVNSTASDAENNDEPENVRRSSVSSAEDHEEGMAFRMHIANKIQKVDDFDDYTITADQQKAMQELEKMKQEMDYIGEEDPPEYNVTELLKVLNKELAEDPMPEDRERTIKFKDNLVDVVAPPPEYSDDDFEEENADVKTEAKDNTDDDSDVKKLDESDKQNGDTQERSSSGESSSKSGDSEKVLIEREGKFELVHASDLEAMDLGLGIAEVPSEEVTTQKSEREHVPSPPSQPRPHTANGTSQRPTHAARLQRTRSASSPRSTDLRYDTEGYVSPYGMSNEEKERRRKQNERMEQKKKDEKEKEQYENMQRKHENDEAFQAWLYKKRQEAAARRRDGDKKESEQEAEARRKQQEEEQQSAFIEWMKIKKEKQKEDRQLNRQRKAELESCYYVRPREECERAYKMWVQKKNEQARKARQQAKIQNRYYRLLMRRSRKSQALAKAIRQAQTFHHVDVYGIRS